MFAVSSPNVSFCQSMLKDWLVEEKLKYCRVSVQEPAFIERARGKPASLTGACTAATRTCRTVVLARTIHHASCGGVAWVMLDCPKETSSIDVDVSARTYVVSGQPTATTPQTTATTTCRRCHRTYIISVSLTRSRPLHPGDSTRSPSISCAYKTSIRHRPQIDHMMSKSIHLE